MKFTKEGLLGCELKIEEVKQDGVAFCCVRELSTTERSTFNRLWLEVIDDDYTETEDVFHAFVTCACVCDEDGNLLLTYDDIDKANDIGYPKTLLIKNAADALNYFTQDATDELKKS